MSLPTSETNPDSFLRLPSDQNRQIRQIIRGAGVRDLKQFLNDLRRRSTPQLGYFMELVVSAGLLFAAILLNSYLLLFLAVVFTPFLSPLPGITSSAVIPSLSHLGRSILTLFITSAIYCLAGWLAGLAVKTSSPTSEMPFSFVLQASWLEWAMVLFSAVLLAVWFARRSEMTRLPSIVISLLVMIPLALAGWQLVFVATPTWPEILTLAFGRLLLALLALMATFWVIGLAPRKAIGWVIASLLVIMAVLAGYNVFSPQEQPAVDAISVLPTEVFPPVKPTTNLPTHTLPAPSETPTPFPSATPTSTAVPTDAPTSTPAPSIARITAANGLVMRAEANTQSLILAYINYGDEVQLLGEQATWGSFVWEKIIAPNGKTGWVPNGYLVIVTPEN